MQYVSAKYNDEMRRDNYFFDCLWALATERRFYNSEKNHEPTLDRWHDIVYPKKKVSKIKVTKDMLKARFEALKTKA